MALGNPLCTRAYGKIVNISRSRSRSVSTAPFTRTTGRPTGWNITLESDGAWITTGAWEATWAEPVDVAMRSNRTCALELAIRNFTSITPFLNHPITGVHSICGIRGREVTPPDQKSIKTD